MKKIIALILVVAVLGVGGWLVYDKVITNPERLIVGEWKNDSGVGSYTFNEDGTMSGKIETVLGDPSINGTYSINREAGTITITYTLLSISYNDTRNFTIEDGKLTLTDTSTNTTSTFTKAEA